VSILEELGLAAEPDVDMEKPPPSLLSWRLVLWTTRFSKSCASFLSAWISASKPPSSGAGAAGCGTAGRALVDTASGSPCVCCCSDCCPCAVMTAGPGVEVAVEVEILGPRSLCLLVVVGLRLHCFPRDTQLAHGRGLPQRSLRARQKSHE
jgi:hypothetical protein